MSDSSSSGTRRVVECVANALAALLAIPAVAVFADARHQHRPSADLASLPKRWDPRPLAVDSRRAPQTLVVVVQQGCPFCAASMPFYRELLQARDRSAQNLQVVFAAPQSDAKTSEYLASQGVKPDLVVHFSREELALPVVPALAIVADGRVTASFLGLLSPAQQQALKRQLFRRS